MSFWLTQHEILLDSMRYNNIKLQCELRSSFHETLKKPQESRVSFFVCLQPVPVTSSTVPALALAPKTKYHRVNVPILAHANVITVTNCSCTLYIGWSDVTALWSQHDPYCVGQHVILCVVKWWRFVSHVSGIKFNQLVLKNVHIITILLWK